MICTAVRLFIAGIAVALTSCSVQAAPVRFDARNLNDEKPAIVEVAHAKGLVVVFLSARCPCSASHEAMLKALPQRYPEFTFVGVHSNSDEPEAEASAHFKKAALPFPVLEDAGGKWATEFRAFKTPHAFLVSPTGAVLYQGGVTDSHVAANAKKQFLTDAIDDVQAGKTVRLAEGRTLGCVIARASSN